MAILEFSPIGAARFTLKEIFQVNRFIWILMWSALLVTFGFGLITPIFAIFLTNQIAGGDLVVIGLAEAVYLATKSIFQIPISIMIDKTRGERIDFYCMFIGGTLMTLVPIFYLFAHFPWQVYVLQFIYGLGSAFDWPAWMGLFTRHIDENKESFEWSLQSTLEDGGLALAAGVGGFVADRLGFRPVFMLVAAFSFLTFFLLFVYYLQIRERIHE